MDNPRPGQVHGRVFLKNGWSCSNTRTALAMYVNEFFFLAELEARGRNARVAQCRIAGRSWADRC